MPGAATAHRRPRAMLWTARSIISTICSPSSHISPERNMDSQTAPTLRGFFALKQPSSLTSELAAEVSKPGLEDSRSDPRLPPKLRLGP